MLDYGYGARDQHADDYDDEDDEPPLPRLPPEDAGFLALGVDEVEDAPEQDTPAMARARELHEAGHAHLVLSECRAGLACFFEALGILRGTTVPYPELLYEIALCYRSHGDTAGGRSPRRPPSGSSGAREQAGGAPRPCTARQVCAFLGRKPAMIQALKESSALHPDNARKVKNDPAFRNYVRRSRGAGAGRAGAPRKALTVPNTSRLNR